MRDIKIYQGSYPDLILSTNDPVQLRSTTKIKILDTMVAQLFLYNPILDRLKYLFDLLDQEFLKNVSDQQNPCIFYLKGHDVS